jgi:hypothetical protein
MTSQILIGSGHDGGSNPGKRHDMGWFPLRVASGIFVGGSDDSTLDKLEQMGLQVDEFIGSSVRTATETGVDAVYDTFLRDHICQSVDRDFEPLGEQLFCANSRLNSMAGDCDDGSNVEVVAVEDNMLLLVPQIT